MAQNNRDAYLDREIRLTPGKWFSVPQPEPFTCPACQKEINWLVKLQIHPIALCLSCTFKLAYLDGTT